MLKQIWSNLYGHRASNEEESLTGIPISTIAYHEKRREKRALSRGTGYWDTEEGQLFLKRMIISVIYTFAIKGGVGAGRIREHLSHLHLGAVAAISESSIYGLIGEISTAILLYKELQEQQLEE